MAIELKDVFTYLGMDEKEITDIDKFKSGFAGKYDTKDNFFESPEYKEKIAKTNGIFVSLLKKEANANGLELNDADLKDETGKYKKHEDILKLTFKKVNDLHTAATEKIKGEYETNKDKGVTEWQNKYTLAEGKIKDLERINAEQKTEFDNTQKTFSGEVKKVKLNTKKNELFGKLQWKAGITDLEKAGFNSVFESKYVIDLDDKDEPFITDKNGARIANPTTHGAFKTPDEVLKEEAVANNVFQLNKDGGRPAPVGGGGGIFNTGYGSNRKPETPAASPGTPPAEQKVFISDRAQRIAEQRQSNSK